MHKFIQTSESFKLSYTLHARQLECWHVAIDITMILDFAFWHYNNGRRVVVK